MKNKALFLASMQHELAMAIGNELDLKLMLKSFLKVCFKRLNLTSAHVYTLQGGPSPQPLLHTPPKNSGENWDLNPLLTQTLADLTTQEEVVNNDGNERHFYGFILPDHGFIIFETHFVFEVEITRALKPIFKKLGNSCYSCIVHDSLLVEINARKEAEARVTFQSKHDGLTGLHNRQYFNELLKKAYDEAQLTLNFNAVIFVDLNQFKPINDVMGHRVGDQILLNVANRFKNISSQKINVARFGGDEFIFLLSDLGQVYEQALELTQQTIEHINQCFMPPYRVAGNYYKLTASLGFTLFPQDNIVDDIITCADIAMYEAKKAKSHTGIMYKPEMSEKINQRLQYIEDMKASLVRNDFELHYQPQYNSEHKIIGAEALLRWNHPTRGYESPAIYIPIAEESDLILSIGEWVLKQACIDIKLIEELDLPTSFNKISINVSAKQLMQKEFEQLVLNNINKTGISAKRLALELTENLLVSSFDESIRLIERLKIKGVDFCIDDFGTGYSSLTYLKRIPASVLKIDRSFVADIDKNDDGLAIANMIISLGKSLQMDVLAEGVENEAELNCLKALGCFQYQGFYFSKPIPFNELIDLLKKQS